MAQVKDTETTEWVPLYISFRTITDLITRMAAEEPPSRIDKSYLTSFAGGYQTQVIGALNAFGLRDKETGKLTETMTQLVKGTESERKELIKALLEKYYGSINKLGTNATQSQMLEGFKELGVNPGDTMRKSVSFYLNAAKYAGVPVSKYWKTPGVARKKVQRGDGGGNLARGSDNGGPDDTGKGGDGAGGSGGEGSPNLRTVSLRSGGSATFAFQVDFFTLSEDDRAWVLDMVDKMRKYGGGFPALPVGVDDAEDDLEDESEGNDS